MTMRTLEIDPSVALLLPCNVVLDATESGGTRVRVVDPIELMNDPRFAESVGEAAEKLQSAVDDLRARASAWGMSPTRCLARSSFGSFPTARTSSRSVA